MPHRDISVGIKQAINPSMLNIEVRSQTICFNEDAITLHHNQSGVSILTKVYFFSSGYNWILNNVITSYALFYITKLSNHNMGMTELYISIYIEWVNRNT